MEDQQRNYEMKIPREISMNVSSSVQIGMFHLPFVNPQCSALGSPVEKGRFS